MVRKFLFTALLGLNAFGMDATFNAAFESESVEIKALTTQSAVRGVVLEEDHSTPLLEWKTEFKRDGTELRVDTRFLQRETETVHTSEHYVQKNGQFYSYRYDRANVFEQASVIVDGDSLIFRRTYIDGGRRKHSEHVRTYPDKFVVGAGLFIFIAENFSQLKSGQPIRIQFGALELGKCVEFELRWELDANSPKTKHRIRMRPTNWIYRLFSDTIYFTYDGDNFMPTEIRSALLPLILKKGDPTRIFGVYRVDQANEVALRSLLDY